MHEKLNRKSNMNWRTLTALSLHATYEPTNKPYIQYIQCSHISHFITHWIYHKTWKLNSNLCVGRYVPQGYKRDRSPVSDVSGLSDLPLSVELLPGCGAVEYFGRWQIKRRSSSFLIHRSSLVSSLIADFLVTSGVKQANISNLLVTYRTREFRKYCTYSI